MFTDNDLDTIKKITEDIKNDNSLSAIKEEFMRAMIEKIYKTTYNAIWEEVKTMTQEEAYNRGYKDGYNGYNQGYKAGYDDGYDDGLMAGVI